ncbi:acetate--CoA ligase [Nesterenkonia alkaliphila]|uniref:acetate--CoA ligase n=1 Tax=Nesterenkonia alkaliphila TaxID=1463631 RepID=A0A7K1UIL4_9MICC|nr:acetate--CoA ligase [Nesterenkonia alkaliphila]MVT26320.1 acetate--CoA ligase [Nesterenkonia alkaliphila]GFZ88335.1 acetyl-coenzyme A synthetase [Nesterenkonia alkaliphila]
MTADVHRWAEPSIEEERLRFWERAAGLLSWQTRWHTAHSWTPPDPERRRGPEIRWFEGGRLNAAVNCADRHVAAGHGEKAALHFEGEPGDRETVSYAELARRVAQAANALDSLGITAGDRVVIYLPVLVETIVITLACARIGAVHQLVFGGFSAEALRFRVADTGAKLLVTTDGQYRRGTAVPVKENADAAVQGLTPAEGGNLEHVLVIRRTGSQIPWNSEDLNGDGRGRDLWWHELVETASAEHEPKFFDAESPLFIMYTSGTTGKPKGLVHTTGGYLTAGLYSYLRLFAHPDPDRREHDVHWCTADLAWVTAHTYEIYGPLAAGATQVIYEGVPKVPHPGRHFEIIARHRVTSYYTAPTLVRSLMGWFPGGVPTEYDLSSVRIAGTVGEAVNPEAASWLRSQIGRDTRDAQNRPVLPLVDTWWQSESGSAVLSPRPERDPARFKPGSVASPLPGWDAGVVDDSGRPTDPGVQGNVVITRPGPSMARTVWGNPERFYTSYWEKYAHAEGGRGWFLAGDAGQCDAEGDIWILGRIDDAINVSGHLLSTIEIESALVSHPDVVEAGVAPVHNATTGHAVAAFVVLSTSAWQRLEEDPAAGPELLSRLRSHVAEVIGPVAKPRTVIPVPEVPKTRSGKIMRRLLTQLHDGHPLGDTTSLQNEPCVPRIQQICQTLGTAPVKENAPQ